MDEPSSVYESERGPHSAFWSLLNRWIFLAVINQKLCSWLKLYPGLIRSGKYSDVNLTRTIIYNFLRGNEVITGNISNIMVGPSDSTIKSKLGSSVFKM